MNHDHDVAIIGGGPSGSTMATLLRKYDPQLRVVILEREKFPRAHIGESQLPAIGPILAEMGVWEKVEEAGFPIKLGATFTWGRDGERWDLDFYPVERFQDEPRPARYEGQRRSTAFQVERAVYDDILLRHAQACGALVREETSVREVQRDGDRIERLVLGSGEPLTARYYVDGSGSAGFLRRALGVATKAPTELRNIAIYDYWEDAEWAITIGRGGTRIQVRSLPYGWIWFIPIAATTVSIGLVCPSEYYKSRGLSAEELFAEALASEPTVGALIAKARQRGKVQTVKDWSHLSERLVGDNWFLVGEAAGFADPILSAGMTLAHTSAREAAYTILEIERGELDAGWLKESYETKTRRNIHQHIQFAQYWYASNGIFTELKEHCRNIAREAGFSMAPEKSWRWLALGGFANHTPTAVRLGSFDLGLAISLVDKFAGAKQGAARYQLEQVNVLKLDLEGAEEAFLGDYGEGRVRQVSCFRRGSKVLPNVGPYQNLIAMLRKTKDMGALYEMLQQGIAANVPPKNRDLALTEHLYALEAMLIGGWVKGKLDKRRGQVKLGNLGQHMRRTAESMKALEKRKGVNVKEARGG